MVLRLMFEHNIVVVVVFFLVFSFIFIAVLFYFLFCKLFFLLPAGLSTRSFDMLSIWSQ